MSKKWGVARDYRNVELSEDELMHKSHKYIKRYWKNDKWRYVYKDSKGKEKDLKVLSKLADLAGADEKEQYRRVNEKYEKAGYKGLDEETALNYTHRRINDAQDRYSEVSFARAYPESNIAKKNPNLITMSDKNFKKLKESSNATIKKANADAKMIGDHVSKRKAYEKTLIGFTETTINKGNNFINNLFKKK